MENFEENNLNKKKIIEENRKKADERLEEYKKEQTERFKGLSEEKSLEHNEYKNNFIETLAPDYIKAVIDPDFYEKNKERLNGYLLLKNKLKGSNLVDLGCGGPSSAELAYKFASAFDVEKYIGVEKYLYGSNSGEKESYEKGDYDNNIKKILEQDTKNILPKYEFSLNKDMLAFLSERTEQSNFLISGISREILMPSFSFASENQKMYQEYVEDLENQISRLTPKGGIVIVNHSFIDLEKLGFKKSYLTNSDNEEELIWEKI